MWTVDLTNDRTSVMAPSEYLKLYTEHPERIKRARMIPPRLGKDRHFGKMRVVLASGRYEAVR